MDNRIEMILNDKGLDALIISDFYNMRYVSGYSGDAGYMYVSGKRQCIITDSRYTVRAKEEAPSFEIVEMNSKKGYKDILSGFLEDEEAVNVGFEDKAVSYLDYKMLSGLKAGLNLVELGDALSNLRCIKTSKEIEYIAQAEHIGDIAFSKILDFIKPGMTELEVAAKLEYTMKCEGASGLSFDTIVASGINSSKPHAVPGEKVIEKGDFVTMDFGCIYKGYCSDMTRTIVVGQASEEQKKVYETVLSAQKAALDVIRAGMVCKDVDKVARDLIAQAGYGKYFGHGLGHSVGLYIHENPALNTRCEEVLKENMLETVEPGIYIEGFGGVRIEDLVVVTKDGHRNLTSSPKELIIL